jgi:hypothetical protein
MARLESLIEVLDRSKKRIAIAFVAAVLLHLPMTPAMPVLRMVHRLSKSQTPPVRSQEAPQPREVQVELQEAVRQEQLRKEQLAQPEPPKTEGLTMAPPPVAVKFSQAAPTPKADADKPKEPKTEKEKVKDVGLEGVASKLTGKPGITLGLWFSSLRDNPLGPRLVEMAACDREWKIFVDQGVDLIRDFEGALVVGPGLFEPKQMTVAVRHSLPGERVHAVIDGLVQNSGANGRWVEPDVATARLGRVQRMLIPQQEDLFFVAPSKGWEALHKVKEPLRVPSSEGRLVSLVLAPPTKVFERVGLSLPKRISEMRLEVFANADQSIDIRVELEDATAQAAQQDVKRISTQLHDFFADTWALATTLGSLTGASGHDGPSEMAPRLDLSVDEKTLMGMIHLSPSQTRTTLDLAASILCRKSKRAGQKTPKS